MTPIVQLVYGEKVFVLLASGMLDSRHLFTINLLPRSSLLNMQEADYSKYGKYHSVRRHA
jgi:hypothetical protein